MRKRQKEAIFILFFKKYEKYEKYEQLAKYIVHLIGDDPSAPKESIHTILYRIKDKDRLIEKIDEENKNAGMNTDSIYDRKWPFAFILLLLS